MRFAMHRIQAEYDALIEQCDLAERAMIEAEAEFERSPVDCIKKFECRGSDSCLLRASNAILRLAHPSEVLKGSAWWALWPPLDRDQNALLEKLKQGYISRSNALRMRWDALREKYMPVSDQLWAQVKEAYAKPKPAPKPEPKPISMADVIAEVNRVEHENTKLRAQLTAEQRLVAELKSINDKLLSPDPMLRPQRVGPDVEELVRRAKKVEEITQLCAPSAAAKNQDLLLAINAMSLQANIVHQLFRN